MRPGTRRSPSPAPSFPRPSGGSPKTTDSHRSGDPVRPDRYLIVSSGASLGNQSNSLLPGFVDPLRRGAAPRVHRRAEDALTVPLGATRRSGRSAHSGNWLARSRCTSASSISSSSVCILAVTLTHNQTTLLLPCVDEVGFASWARGAGSLMGATRKRTRSCSDSMHDPNCPRLRQCSRMSPDRIAAWLVKLDLRCLEKASRGSRIRAWQRSVLP